MHHHARKDLHEQQYDKLADGRRRVEQHDFFEPYAHDEVDDHGHPREQDASRHSLAVEHEEERQVDQGRTGFFLRHDEQHGQDDDGHRGRKMLPTMDVEAVGAHEFGHRQCRGELGKFGRLQAERAQDEPRPRAFYLMGIEYSEEKQQKKGRINDVGERVIEAVIHHQEDETEAYRRADP